MALLQPGLNADLMLTGGYHHAGTRSRYPQDQAIEGLFLL